MSSRKLPQASNGRVKPAPPPPPPPKNHELVKRPTWIGGRANVPRTVTTVDATNSLPRTGWQPAAWYWANDADAYMDALEVLLRRAQKELMHYHHPNDGFVEHCPTCHIDKDIDAILKEKV